MATTTVQAPAAPPTPSVATTRSSLARRQSSLVSSGASISSTSPQASNLAMPQHQRPHLTLQTPVQSPTSASTPFHASGTSSQASSAASQTQFFTPTSATTPLASTIPFSNSPISTSPTSSLTSSQQTATNPHAYSAPTATTSPPRSLMQRTSDKVGVWNLCIAVAIGIATIAATVYYSETMLRYAKWTKHNDCINDQEHGLPLSTECSEELLRARVSVEKRQVEAVHVSVRSKARDMGFAARAGMILAAGCIISLVTGLSFGSLVKVQRPRDGQVPAIAWYGACLVYVPLSLGVVMASAVFVHRETLTESLRQSLRNGA
jgi:hypothetical protein